jgi:hypothetical protein
MQILLIVGILISAIGTVMLATYISHPDSFQTQTLTVSIVLLSSGLLFIGLYLCSSYKFRIRDRTIVEHYEGSYT